MINLELTPEKAQALTDLIDLACKAGGINAARAAVPIMDDLMVAVAKSQQAEDNAD